MSTNILAECSRPAIVIQCCNLNTDHITRSWLLHVKQSSSGNHIACNDLYGIITTSSESSPGNEGLFLALPKKLFGSIWYCFQSLSSPSKVVCYLRFVQYVIESHTIDIFGIYKGKLSTPNFYLFIMAEQLINASIH